MPTYTAQCTKCRYRFDIFRKIDDRDVPANCEKCAAVATRIIDKARIAPDYAPYNCPITGELITGRRQHEENLKKHGCRIYEPGELEEHRKFVEQESERQIDQLAEAAVQEALALPPEKQETLAAELTLGAGTGDCGFIRTTAE